MHEVIPRSVRAREWQEFSDKVMTHIDNYTVPQYGDKGEDQIDNWDIEACILVLTKYLRRIDHNIRPGQALLDMLKAAHYINFIYDKMSERVKDDMDQKTEEKRMFWP